MASLNKMTDCICFVCRKVFQSEREDDVEGDGECADCLEAKKFVVAKVDADMLKRREARKEKETQKIKLKTNIYFDAGN